MIAVLGPAELAMAVAAAVRGELVVGAADDEGLGGPIEEAASSAAELPLPVRACVVAAADPAEACARVRAVGGALRDATVYLVGTPTDVTAEQWEQAARVWDAVPARDVDELAERLTGIEVRGTPVNGRRGRRRPGAPDEAAWREWLSASPKRRGLPFARRPQPGRLRRRDEAGLDAAIRRPLDPSCRIAVASPKGGVGKTLLSFLLGSVLAQLRGGKVAAADANPDFGTLADLVDSRVPATISDLIRDRPRVGCDLADFLTATETGMTILAAPQDPVEMGRVGSAGFLAVDQMLARSHDIVLYDCGTGFLDEITQCALAQADQIVLVAAPQLVTAKIIINAVAHLEATGFDLERTTVVLNMIRRGDHVDGERLRAALSVSQRSDSIVEIPYDARLARDIDLGSFRYSELSTATRLALKRLAAEVVGRLGVARTELVGRR